MTYPKLLIAAGALFVLIAAVLFVADPRSDGTSAGSVLQGDVDCNQHIDDMDALGVLRKAGDIEPFPACIDLAGDVDCDQDIDAEDAVAILLHTAALDVAQTAGGCTPIGAPIISPTETLVVITDHPTPTPPPTAPPSTPASLCAGPGGGPSLADDPGNVTAPQPDVYRGASVLTANYLGDAAEPNIELALMPGHPNVGIVVTQDGYMYRVALDQSFSPSLWGDLHTIVQFDQGEQGLLALAFSPDFETDCRVYVYYSTTNPEETRLARLTATPTGLNEGSLEVVLHVEDFAGNHNGGHIAFDNAGLLYLSTGDGGGGDDPQDTGQDINRLLGKVLRLDVSGATGYTVPPTNPYVGKVGADEIFAIGFRNPFRMTIDPVSDEVWLGDVGQGLWEEVDHVTLGGNYGWDCLEGNAPHDTDADCSGKTFVAPRAVYDHGDNNQAVTGGVIYRGDNMPELYGWYVYADFYSGNVWAVDTEGGGPPVHLMDAPFATSSFTLAPDGEVWFVSYSDGVYQLTR